MSEFKDFHSVALSETIDFVGEPVVYEAKTFLAVVNNIALEEELADGGIKVSTGAIAICKKCDFESLPAIGKTLLYSGRRLRILKVEADVSSYEITLANADR